MAKQEEIRTDARLTRSGCKTLRQRERGIVTATVKIALDDGLALLALTIDERAIILAQLDDPPEGLAQLRGVLLNEHQWRQRQGLG